MDLMVDIETLALTPRSVITSMAWVGFDSERIIFAQSHVLDWGYQMERMKRDVDAGTLRFHMQHPEAMKLWINGADDPLHMPLWSYYTACGRATRIWAKPTRFDIVVLNDLARDLRPGFKDLNHKKYRDVHPLQDALKPDELPPDSGLAHDPLADCYWQIGVVQRYYKKLAAMEAAYAKVEPSPEPLHPIGEEATASAQATTPRFGPDEVVTTA